MERTKKSIDAKLAKLNDQSRKDDVVTFEELGIDRLFVDEAHYYKNLAAFSKMRNVGGISQTEAQKSSDLYMKCRYLDELTGGRGVVFATGTPISNTMVETVYHAEVFAVRHALEEHGLLNFDAWASTFGETVTAIELAPEGTGYRAKTRFSRFYNLPELMSMFKEVADIQTADMLKLPVPKANYAQYRAETIGTAEGDGGGAVGERAEKVRNRMVDPHRGQHAAHHQRRAQAGSGPAADSTPCSRTATPARSTPARRMSLTSGSAQRTSVPRRWCSATCPRRQGTTARSIQRLR